MSCASEFYLRKTNETFKLPCRSSSDIHNVYELPNAQSCDWFDVDFISVRKITLLSTLISIIISSPIIIRQNFEATTSISVPVGVQSMGIPVFIGTLLVAWGAAAYLIFAVLKQKKRISKKVS